MDEADDRVAVRAVREGDREAFAILVRRYQEVAFRAAYLVLRDAAAAEDVTQEAFLRAHRALARFRESEPFRPWLLRIVTNLALNEARSLERRRALLGRVRAVGPATEPAADAAVVQSEMKEAVLAAINSLHLDDRVVLYLRYVLDLSEAEIAVAIGKRPGTVKSRLSRASGRLRTVIERDFRGLRNWTGGGVARDA